MRGIIWLTMVAVVALLLPLAAQRAQPASDTVLAAADPGPCTRMTDEQLVAQLLGAPISSPGMTEAIATMAAEHVGTVVLLGGAIESGPQVTGLIGELHAWAPPGLDPLIAVDEEGGRVARFGRAGVTVHLPSARTQAATGTVDDVRAQAAGLGQQMAALGVDYNLAPVLDLWAGDANGIVGDRSFSADPVAAGDHGAAFAAGMRDAGIVTSAKHFPDHGLSTTDTHTGVAVVEVSVEALRGAHLEPYRRALPHVDSIMLSHLRIPALDPHLPVSLSPAAVAFLRHELRNPATRVPYDGVVVTDDLSMRAVAAVADQSTAALLALQAGADLALAGSVDAAGAAHARLVAALGSGELPRLRAAEAAARVLRLKGLDEQRVGCLVGPTHYTRPG